MGGNTEFDRRIQAGPANFPLAVRRGEDSWAELAERTAAFGADRFLLVADGAAPADQLARVRAMAAAYAPCTVLDLRSAPPPAGPRADRPPSERPAAEGRRTGRRTVVIALGGEQACAVAADLRVPTTLAAAVGPALTLRRPPPDARALPARTAPALVWVRSDLLADRPVPETRAGMIDVIRHVLAVCPAQYQALAGSVDPEARYSAGAVAAFLAVCADARAALVCFDPFETGPALALGYGRSLAALVRSLAGRPLAPGDAEALGLLLAARIAVRLGLLDAAGAWAHRELLARNGSVTALPGAPDGAAFADAVAAARAPGPGVLLLAGLGRPYCVRGRLLTPVGAPLLRDAAESLGPVAVPHGRVPEPQPATG
ncbi:3-dehydroquinate synthase family protein [Kitasatospora sp. NPDC003701]